ncbi:MAG TPA: DEAD/DEAH box helicase, partial [Candidatus Nanopelagicales bacterium]|nr:DEAD/DEAH box helicase [Candidatus Nanopelagicales bacterium]
MNEADVAATAQRVIEALAGPTARVRDDQLAAVRALVVQRRRALVVQATGWGKSAVYWIAARAVRDAGAGPVLVVSPLLALMRDQVAAAARAGLRAVTLNSGNFADWQQIEQELADGSVDVLLVSPERLANPRFAATVLEPMLARLGLLVIDEAHCISSWGHDFRPDYQRIARLLLARPELPVLATTATANERVTADVAAQLGPDTLVQRGRLARDSLHLAVVPGLDPLQRYAWVDTALRALPGSGIVYVLTVAETERLTGFLAEQGHRVAAYSGRLEAADRAAVEDALRDNDLKAVIATSALGMGYD